MRRAERSSAELPTEARPLHSNSRKILRRCQVLSDTRACFVGTRCGMSSPRLIKGRRSEIGHYYSITTSTSARSPIFSDRIATQCAIAALDSADASGSITTIAWIVMPDHLHWLFRLEESALSRIVQKMKCMSANRINTALRRQGAVWQAGFFDHRIRTEEDLGKQARYIIENPVRAGIASSICEYPYWRCVGFR